MCGIVGYLSNCGYSDSLEDKLDLIKHRGPDSQGVFVDSSNDLNIGLGHVRLSILDLSEEGSQPFSSKCGRYVMVYNGEIYNFQELKKSITDHEFVSTSDTEVLMELFVRHGVEMLNSLEGIFAVCIYDKQKETSYLIRDQLGIKPLYYYQDNHKLVFASELKALFAFDGIEKKMEKNCLTEFLFNGFIYEPNTGFDKVLKVKPGSYIKIDFKEDRASIESIEYWKPAQKISGVTNQEEVDDLVSKTINDQTVSDVPVGLFYSGGIDSSVILVKLVNKIKSFVVTRKEDVYEGTGMVNDFDYAKKIAKHLKTDLTEVSIENELKTGDDFIKLVDDLTYKVEEPISDFTFVSSELLSREVKNKGYTVMLSGMGADEIFAGYPRYTLVKYEKLIKPIARLMFPVLKKKKSFAKKINRLKSFLDESSFEIKYSNLIGSFSKEEVRYLLGNDYEETKYIKKLEGLLEGYENYSPIKKAMLLDLHGFLSHNFIVADKSSMLQSVELRVPLVSHKYYDLIFSKKIKLMSISKTKIPLRKILYKFLPKDLVDRKKTGFNPPLDDLIRNLGPSKCIDVFEKNQLFKYVNESLVKEIVTDHFEEKGNNTFKIFQLLFISFWIRNNFV